MKGLSQTQLEQLQQIGEQLAHERERKKVPLDQIALKTYIPLRQLQALEVGNTEILPEPVFVQGFIRRYADALGLDGEALAQTFEYQSAPLANPVLVIDNESTPQPKRQQPAKRTSPVSPKPLSGEAAPNWDWLILGLMSLAALILGGALYTYYESLTQAGKKATNQPKSASTQRPQPNQTVLNPTPSPSASQAQPSPLTAPVQVSVTATGEAWLEVIVDNRKPAVFVETVQKGFAKTWTAKKSLQLTAGNAGNVQVSFNQAAPKVLGALGQPTTVTYSPKPASQ
jgi:cytoskeletal protein RodZ